MFCTCLTESELNCFWSEVILGLAVLVDGSHTGLGPYYWLGIIHNA